jgi:hypothetical protein
VAKRGEKRNPLVLMMKTFSDDFWDFLLEAPLEVCFFLLPEEVFLAFEASLPFVDALPPLFFDAISLFAVFFLAEEPRGGIPETP